MDFEDICHEIHAPGLVSYPRNQEHFEAQLPEALAELEHRLPLYVCCEGGHLEHGSATVPETDVEIFEFSTDEAGHQSHL